MQAARLSRSGGGSHTAVGCRIAAQRLSFSVACRGCFVIRDVMKDYGSSMGHVCWDRLRFSPSANARVRSRPAARRRRHSLRTHRGDAAIHSAFIFKRASV